MLVRVVLDVEVDDNAQVSDVGQFVVEACQHAADSVQGAKVPGFAINDHFAVKD